MLSCVCPPDFTVSFLRQPRVLLKLNRCKIPADPRYWERETLTASPLTSSEKIENVARAILPTGEDVLELGVRGVPRRFDQRAPRWFVPMGNWRVRRTGSEIYPAFRRGARAYRAALRAWTVVGGAKFTHRVEEPRGGGWSLGELLSSDMPTLSTAAVSIGIPGPAQKITVQLMDGRGGLLGFAKYADNPYSQTLIANEARILGKLPENVGPRLLKFAPFLDGDLMVQTALPGRPLPPRSNLKRAQIDFFERLVREDGYFTASKHPFVKSLYEDAGGRREMFGPILEGFGGSEWPVAWMHGDMAPWNLHLWRGRCMAFDWEHGREIGFAYLDAAATLIQVASIIRRGDPGKAKRSVSRGLRDCFPVGYGKFAPAVASLSALNMLVSWYPPRTPDAYEEWLGAFIRTPV